MATVATNSTFALKLGSGSPLTYTAIPGVTNFDGGNISAEQLDATDFDSTGAFREYVNGYKEASEGSFVVNYDPGNATHQALITANGGAAIKLQALYDDRTVTFDALVTAISRPAEVGGILKMTVTIKMTGAPVEADAS